MASTNSRARWMQRVKKDVDELIYHDPDNFLATVNDEMDIVDVIIRGPADSPFEGGNFELRINVLGDFPMKPPLVYFTTPLWHPNVSTAGMICVDILEKKEWKCGTTLLMIVEALRSLLVLPNADSPLNTDAGAMLLRDPFMYKSTVQAYSNIYADAPDNLPPCFRDKISTLVERYALTKQEALRRLARSKWVVSDSIRASRRTEL